MFVKLIIMYTPILYFSYIHISLGVQIRKGAYDDCKSETNKSLLPEVL